MNILILPLLIILLPVTLLFSIIKYWKKGKQVSIVQKIVLGIVFAVLGLVLMSCPEIALQKSTLKK